MEFGLVPTGTKVAAANNNWKIMGNAFTAEKNLGAHRRPNRRGQRDGVSEVARLTGRPITHVR